ncbi:MAG: hypothetical protein ACRDE2_00055 [Chitinophagaceae bacterium]
MKKHHVILLIGGIIIVSAIVYEYAKKHSCSCKGGLSKCSCNKKSMTAATASSANSVNSNTSALSGRVSNPVIVPSTGMAQTDNIIVANGNAWSSCDGLSPDYPVIDPIAHKVIE